MSQALLISNNEVVNSMYEVNLRAYVAMNITVKTFVDDAVELLELNPSYDVIIIFSELCLISILSVSRLSSNFACCFINVIFELKSLILFTPNKSNIRSNLFLRSKEVSDLFKLSKLNLKKFSKNNPTA